MKKSKIVFCVDDDEDDREMVCTVIQNIDASIKVIQAENGVIAHELLTSAKERKEFPCLIILDINMPKMDGKETLIQIKSDNDLNKIPVAMFTTSSSPADKLFCSNLGVELITKPSQMDNIHSEVSKLLSHCSN